MSLYITLLLLSCRSVFIYLLIEFRVNSADLRVCDTVALTFGIKDRIDVETGSCWLSGRKANSLDQLFL